MRNLLLATTCACLLGILTPACGGGDSSSSQQQQQPAGTITGRERIGWDQQAPDALELAQYSYVLYVDDRPVELTAATCGALSGQGPTASCSSPLPALPNGQHTLELATRVNRNWEVVESVRSAPLVVTVAGSTSAASGSLTVTTGQLRFPESAPFVVEMAVSGLDRPSSLAALPDGRLLIAEHGGRIRIADSGQLREASALELPVAEGDDDGGVSIAVAPDFAANRYVYVSYATRDNAGLRIGRVARYREVAGTLGEPAVVLEGLPAEAGAPLMKVGPDGTLFVTAPARDAREAADLSSLEGKVLRFDAAGGTPANNPLRFSPVFSSGYTGRLDLDWQPTTRELWYAESSAQGVTIGLVRSGRAGEPLVRLDGMRSAGMAFHAAAAVSDWSGSLFLASLDEQCLLRVSGLSEAPPRPAVERVLSGFGRIAAVLSSDDGLYFASSSNPAGGEGAPVGAVYRVRDKTSHR